MKKIILCLVELLFIILGKSQDFEGDNIYVRNSIILKDSIATVMYQDTLTNTEFVRNYVASVLASGVVPDSSFIEGSIDTLKTYIVYFDTINDGYANIKGGLVWDTTHQTLTIFNGNGSSTQIGQEQNIYVHNVSGSDIFAGDPIYIIPHNADEIRVGLASNLNAVTAYGCIGIATTDIPHGGTGRICSFGQVHDLNTDSWAEGAYLWLGDGVLQQTKPTSGHLVVIGQNLDKSATEGIIGVKVSFNSSRQYAVLTTDGLSGTYIDSTSITVDSLIADSVFTNTVHTDTLKIGDKTEIYEDVNDIFQIDYNNFGANSHLTLGYEGANLSADGVLTLQSLDRIDLQGTALNLTGLGTDKGEGRIYTGTSDPTNTTRANYDGNLHATALKADTIYTDTITAIKGKFDTLEVNNSVDAESAQISKLNIDTVNSVKIIADTLVLNGAAITDTIDLKSAVEAETFDKIKIGISTDTVVINDYGIHLYGNATQWTDVAITGFHITTLTTAPTFTTGWAGSSAIGAWYYQGTVQDDIAYFNMQMPHGLVDDDTLSIHFHWGPVTSPVSTDTAVFLFTYSYANINSVFQATASERIVIPLTGKSQWGHYITNLYLSPTGTGSLSRIWNCSLKRLANSDASDTYTNSVGMLSIDAHARIEAFGSNQMITE